MMASDYLSPSTTNTRIRPVYLVIFLLLYTSPVFASGWNDFELQIDPDFTIFRANSLDVLLCDINGIVILGPYDYADVGPIVEYAVTGSHIFTRHIGRKLRNLFAGDTLEEIDPSREFFFIVNKTSKKVSGPFNLTQFQLHPVVQPSSPVPWKAPRNPNIWMPLAGSLMALGYILIIYGGSIALILLVACIPLALLWRLHQRRLRSTKDGMDSL